MYIIRVWVSPDKYFDKSNQEDAFSFKQRTGFKYLEKGRYDKVVYCPDTEKEEIKYYDASDSITKEQYDNYRTRYYLLKAIKELT